MRKLLFFLLVLGCAAPSWAATTNFPNGVTNTSPSRIFGQLIIPNQASVHAFMEEFDTWYSVSLNYTLTETSANSTQVMASADMGVLTMTNLASATNDVTVIQKIGQNFQFESGKKLYLETRFKVDSVTTSNLLIGLAITDTSPFDVTDGIFFQKDSGTTLNLIVRKASTATTQNVGTAMEANTYIRVGFCYDGISAVKVYCNGTHIADLATTNLYTAGAFSPIFSVRSTATAQTVILSMDYLYIVKER